MSGASSRHLVAVAVAGLLAGACGGPVEPGGAAAACGNGRVEAGEECDDGNASNTDSCLTSCFVPARFVSSDPHLHGAGCDVPPTPPAGLAQRMATEGLEVGAALIWGDGYDDRPLFTGADHPASSGGRILHYDLEVSAFPAGDSGHLVLLGLRDVDFSADPFRGPALRAQPPRLGEGAGRARCGRHGAWPALDRVGLPDAARLLLHPVGLPDPGCAWRRELPAHRAPRSGPADRRADVPPLAD